jgi:exodeoxyribonuclease-3
MKVATWNVNGIRARQAQLQEWIALERPDVVCLQEIKATQDQVPAALCEMEGYWCYWHGGKGYSGVGLHVSKTIHPDRPSFSHPAFDFENRIVLVEVAGVTIASVYVPNGGKDFPAKMQFLSALEQFTAALHAESRPVVVCGDLNIARTDMDVHPKERKPAAIGQLPEERARAGQRPDVHLVGAVAEHAPAQLRMAAGLRAGEPHVVRPDPALRDTEGRRHQRPRAGAGGVCDGRVTR